MDRGEEEAPIAGSQDGNMNDLQYEANNHHASDVEISLLSCSNDVNDAYIPQVSENLKPTVGQEFLSIDEALEFYIKYSKKAGFSVRSNSSKRHKGTNEVIRKEFFCYKEGESSKKGSKKKRCQGIIRDNCKAKLAVVMSKMGKYVISLFVEKHSHPLSSPKKVHLLRSHRNVSKAKKSLTQQFSAANVPTHQQISILEFKARGIENIGCTKKDTYNYEAKLHNEMRGQDAELLKEYFLTEQERDPSFMFEIDADDECKLKRCFWSDSVCRRAYGCFGDVVVFETTYNANQYGMIFAPLVGVNNHGQTVIFAYAFLSDERTESFVWLFELLKKSMPANTPNMIITDQDPTMTKLECQGANVQKAFKHFSRELVDNIMSNEEAAVIVNDALQSLVDQFKSIGGSTKSGGIFEKGSNVIDTTLKDPSQVRAKGCGRRLKGGKEKATNAAKYRGRRCNGCGKIDQAHDKRNCLVLNNR
nr:protein FAR1-RELATED SEQUENCE 5-like [Ziziphus jujuba var. spinosa]